MKIKYYFSFMFFALALVTISKAQNSSSKKYAQAAKTVIDNNIRMEDKVVIKKDRNQKPFSDSKGRKIATDNFGVESLAVPNPELENMDAENKKQTSNK